MTVLGERIKKERIGCGLSIEELAQQLHVTTEELKALEEGKEYPKVYLCQKLEEILNIPHEIILEDTRYSKLIYHAEPVLSSPQQKRMQIFLLSMLMVFELAFAFLALMEEETGGMFLIQIIAVVFGVVGVVLTVKGEMHRTSTGWFVGIPFLNSGLSHVWIMTSDSDYIEFGYILADIFIILVSIVMIAVFILRLSSVWYYLIQILCYAAIVTGLYFLIAASYAIAIGYSLCYVMEIISVSLFRLQVAADYKKRNWLGLNN